MTTSINSSSDGGTIRFKVEERSMQTITFPDLTEKLPFTVSRDPKTGSLILDFDEGINVTVNNTEKKEQKEDSE